jgi:hypothetical protein
MDLVTIAILIKDKEHTLPFFLKCVSEFSYPKNRTLLYIRTNNNSDNSEAVISEWINEYLDQYLKIYYDNSDLQDSLTKYKPHEWNQERFKALGRIRQDSLDFAIRNKTHYFVIDCDNFVYTPDIIEIMLNSNLGIVAPLLRTCNTEYSNFHSKLDAWGYMLKDSPTYDLLVYSKIKGLVEMPVVHCTYFIRNKFLPFCSYDDNSNRHEYVIFSHTLRTKNIPQYLDTRKVYGMITFKSEKAEIEAEINSFRKSFPTAF